LSGWEEGIPVRSGSSRRAPIGIFLLTWLSKGKTQTLSPGEISNATILGRWTWRGVRLAKELNSVGS
jgi:hypothetical protein